MAVEAVDRAMRGQTSPTPDLGGRGRRHRLAARRAGGPLRGAAARGRARPSAAILDTYTKEHSAEYQAQAWIDLARKLGAKHPELRDPANIDTHRAAHQPPHALRDRLGRERPAEVRPDAPAARRSTTRSRTSSPSRCRTARGTTTRSYAPERAGRPDTVALWHKVTTVEDPEWTRRYHSNDPAEKAFGGRVEIDAHRRRRASSTRSPSPTRTRSARGRSPAPTTSRKFRTLAERRARRRRDRALPRRRRSACPSSPPPSSASSTSSRAGLPVAAEGTVLMLYSTLTAADKRADFRAKLARGDAARACRAPSTR